MYEVSRSAPDPGPDAESLGWIDALSDTGARRDEAVGRLHELLLRAARFELGRRRHALAGDAPARRPRQSGRRRRAHGDHAQAHTFRGDSRFTTWAYKFALLEAAVKVRRQAWNGREVPLEPDGWARLADRRAAPDTDAETAELIGAVGDLIRARLTPHQRKVLIAVAINDVPIDVLAERMGTTRGALYKTLHDARRKLRSELAAAGYGPLP